MMDWRERQRNGSIGKTELVFVDECKDAGMLTSLLEEEKERDEARGEWKEMRKEMQVNSFLAPTKHWFVGLLCARMIFRSGNAAVEKTAKTATVMKLIGGSIKCVHTGAHSTRDSLKFSEENKGWGSEEFRVEVRCYFIKGARGRHHWSGTRCTGIPWTCSKKNLTQEKHVQSPEGFH